MNSYFTIAYIDYKHTDNGFKIYRQGLVRCAEFSNLWMLILNM